MIQEAAFMLLHLEGSVGYVSSQSLINVGLLLNWRSSNRHEKPIKGLLACSGHKLDNWTALGLAGTLKLPMPWIDEAKVNIFRQLYIVLAFTIP
jgi:nuclear pore complex protein Nup98-Nup96